MSKRLSKILTISVSLLMMASTGSAFDNVHASHHSHQHYIIDIFPSKQTHYNFDYQTHKGYHAHIYEANMHNHLGHSIFGYYGHKKPSRAYEHYLKKHHPWKFHHLKNELRKKINQTKQVKQRKKNNQVIVFNKSYNRKQTKKLVKQLHKHYHHLIYKPDVIQMQNHQIQHGLLIGLHNNNATKELMQKAHQYNRAKLSHKYNKEHPDAIKWFDTNVVQTQSLSGDSVLEHYRQHHRDNKVIELLNLTAKQILNN